MENIKSGVFYLPKSKIIHTVMLVLAAFAVCRVPVMGSCFPVCVALTAYFVARNSKNLYIVIPVAAGIMPYINKGYEPWGELAATFLCAVVFAAARRMNLTVLHQALIAASSSIICISIYRLVSQSVYKLSMQELISEAALIFALVFVFDAVSESVNGTDSVMSERRGRYTAEMTAVSLTVAVCLLVNGAGLDFMLWTVIIFMSIGTFAYNRFGNAMLVTAAGSAVAALTQQAQWGFAATIIIGFAAASLTARYGKVIAILCFSAVCWMFGKVESGVVLGVDGYCLFFAAALFLVINWKFPKVMKEVFVRFAGNVTYAAGEPADRADIVFGTKSAELRELADLYGTYLDSRSMISDQLNVTAQIIDDIRLQMDSRKDHTVHNVGGKFDADIAVSQCAAAGAINGDCCGWQDIGGGRVAMVISDGMGKGKKAAAESMLVTRTILTLLKAGVSVEMILKMVNTIMLMKDDEDSYATVDLVIIDKRSGIAKFYKIGAAPTLIRRKNNVEEVKLAAVPLGIVNGIRIRYVETALRKDDWIIMMSDGVSDGGEMRSGRKNGAFLQNIKEAAADVRSENPRVMSDLILNHAADSYIGRERDDMTVVVARII